MAFNKIQLLDDRIAAIQSEIDDIIDKLVIKHANESPGVPPGVLRNLITSRTGDCQCRTYLHIERNGEI